MLMILPASSPLSFTLKAHCLKVPLCALAKPTSFFLKSFVVVGTGPLSALCLIRSDDAMAAVNQGCEVSKGPVQGKGSQLRRRVGSFRDSPCLFPHTKSSTSILNVRNSIGDLTHSWFCRAVLASMAWDAWKCLYCGLEPAPESCPVQCVIVISDEVPLLTPVSSI
jgi:hypothetical protein